MNTDKDLGFTDTHRWGMNTDGRANCQLQIVNTYYVMGGDSGIHPTTSSILRIDHLPFAFHTHNLIRVHPLSIICVHLWEKNKGGNGFTGQQAH
jgi:hypothetical protein